MRLDLLFPLALGSLAALAGGPIYGTIRLGDTYLSSVLVMVTCPSGMDSTRTDEYGSYRLAAKDRGSCTLTVRYKTEALSIGIVSYDEPVRYRLVLEQIGGKFLLRTE
jgi:hypothetical protein